LSEVRRHGRVESLGDVPAVTNALFTLKPGELSEPLEAPRGFVIAFVEERLPVDEAQFERDKASFRQTALAAKQQQHLAAWFESLRQHARLKSFLEETQDSP
jgi:parvulin-like peptidyl-prolyl isomerase